MMRYYAIKVRHNMSRKSALHTLQELAQIAWDPARTAAISYRLGLVTVDASDVSEVLRLAIDFREYSLFRNVLNWVDVNFVGNNILSLVRTATISGKLELGEIKERCFALYLLSFPRFLPLTVSSLLQHFSKRSLQLNGLCLSALWPVDEAPHPEIEALVSEVIEQFLAKLEGSKLEDIGEDVGCEIVNIFHRYKGYDRFQSRYAPFSPSAGVSSTFVNRLLNLATSQSGTYHHKAHQLNAICLGGCPKICRMGSRRSLANARGR
jgi:hypothetical protein